MRQVYCNAKGKSFLNDTVEGSIHAIPKHYSYYPPKPRYLGPAQTKSVAWISSIDMTVFDFQRDNSRQITQPKPVVPKPRVKLGRLKKRQQPVCKDFQEVYQYLDPRLTLSLKNSMNTLMRTSHYNKELRMVKVLEEHRMKRAMNKSRVQRPKLSPLKRLV